MRHENNLNENIQIQDTHLEEYQTKIILLFTQYRFLSNTII